MVETERQDLLMLLKHTQSEHAYLSSESIIEMARSLDIPVNEVFGVASFYSFLSLEPQGRNVIRICKSVVCYLKESRMIIECVENEIGIRPGETTSNGKFSFELTNCIGACDMAPAMLVNDDVHGHLTPARISEILESYR